MYLLDTNIILELILDREKADDVERFLRKIPLHHLHITEFALYSLGIVLFKQKMHDVFIQSVDDLLISGGIRLLRLGFEDMPDLMNNARQYNLDFDDAYQYTAAEKYDLAIVSFDADFERTEKKMKTPGELLSG